MERFSPFVHIQLIIIIYDSVFVNFSSVQSLSPVWLFGLQHPTNCSMSGFPVHRQLPELAQTMSIRLVKPSNHLILCRPLLLLPSIFPSIRVFLLLLLFFNESVYLLIKISLQSQIHDTVIVICWHAQSGCHVQNGKNNARVPTWGKDSILHFYFSSPIVSVPFL